MSRSFVTSQNRRQTQKALLALAEFQVKSSDAASGPLSSPSPRQAKIVPSPSLKAKAKKIVNSPRLDFPDIRSVIANVYRSV